MNPFSPANIIATVFTGALLLLVLFIAAFVFFTAGDDGGIVWPPRWPARYPARPPQHKARRGLLVGDEEWDRTCRRAGWEPGEETGS